MSVGSDNLYCIEPNMSKEEMRAFIQNERRIELAFEGRHWQGTRRWKIAVNLYNGGPSGSNRVMEH